MCKLVIMSYKTYSTTHNLPLSFSTTRHEVVPYSSSGGLSIDKWLHYADIRRRQRQNSDWINRITGVNQDRNVVKHLDYPTSSVTLSCYTFHPTDVMDDREVARLSDRLTLFLTMMSLNYIIDGWWKIPDRKCWRKTICWRITTMTILQSQTIIYLWWIKEIDSLCRADV